MAILPSPLDEPFSILEHLLLPASSSSSFSPSSSSTTTSSKKVDNREDAALAVLSALKKVKNAIIGNLSRKIELAARRERVALFVALAFKSASFTVGALLRPRYAATTTGSLISSRTTLRLLLKSRDYSALLKRWRSYRPCVPASHVSAERYKHVLQQLTSTTFPQAEKNV